MQTDIDRDVLCSGPDPAPHPPTRFKLPHGAVDTHAHVIGTDFVAQRSYTPPPAPGADYLRMLDATGMTYGVLIQVSVHGADNTEMLDVLRAHRDRLRGVAVVAPDVSDVELARLAEAGVVGLRLNTLSGGGFGFDRIDRYEAICAEMRWHLQLLTNTRRLEEVAARISRLSVPVVVDHLGDVEVTGGLDQPDWKRLIDLVRDGVWMKLSGAFRLSTAPGYADTVPFARELVEAAPDRCVWGSDWPHVGFFGRMPNVGELLDVLADWVPDPDARDAVLTTNAHRLYGFPVAR
jgi:2-pyrone-4,6-dicarboxylate lactonase